MRGLRAFLVTLAVLFGLNGGAAFLSLFGQTAAGGIGFGVACLLCWMVMMPTLPPTLRPAMAGGRGDYDRERYAVKASRKWYNSKHWRIKRRRQLDAEPLCRMCLQEDRIEPATVADHITPHREDERLFWSGPLQSLCATCHSSAKQREERGL